MNIVKVRHLEIGAGRPKVCVPIVGKTEKEIMESIDQIIKHQVDLIEWRADWFEGLTEETRVLNLLAKMREVIKDIPLLFTIRTEAEGGAINISAQLYEEINRNVAKSRLVDMIDIEVYKKGIPVSALIDSLKKEGVFVLGSNHDFTQTPNKEEILHRLCCMQEKGADISKIAVMPNSKNDVIMLLTATEEMVRLHARIPIITMSMGSLGAISRISGGTFGSAVTFGMIGEASAPGQIEVDNLQDILNILYKDV